MLAFRGTLNSGIVKALGINSSFPLLSNVSASSIVLKRNQSGVEQNGNVVLSTMSLMAHAKAYLTCL